MNDFYRLPIDELEQRYAALARRALPLWGMDEKSPLALLKLRENAIYSVRDAKRGEKYVIRIHRAGYHSDAELRSELQWMDALREYGVPTPRLLLSNAGRAFETVTAKEVPEPRQADVVEWIEGRQVGSLESGLSGGAAEISEQYESLGGIMARMHNHAESWREPDGFTRHRWDLNGLVGEQPFWGRFWELPSLNAEQRQLMLTVRDRLREVLADFGTAPDRFGLIHADLLHENILVSAAGPRVIDFDDCGYGWHLFDLVTSLFFLRGEAHFEPAQEALVRGYRQQRPLADERLEQLPAMFMARATTYLGWMHTRAETQTAREMTPFITRLVLDLAADYLAR